MSSRLPSPPRGGRRGGDADHHEEPSVAGSPLGPRRPSKCRRAASSKPAPAPLPAHGSAVLHTPPQSQQQEGSESESELDSPISPPRLIFVTQPEEPGTPTSPGGGSPSIDMKPAMSPKGSTFGSDTEEWHSSDSDDDPYFNSLVENFVIAAEDVRKSTLPDDNIDKKGDHQRKSDLYAESALNHYNNDKKNKIKYELISAITSWEIMDEKGCYSHVNFRAKGNQENSKEELFFASYVGTARPLYQRVCFL